MRRSVRWGLAWTLAVALLGTAAHDAEAALTTSEQAQVRDFVAEARAASAPRVRGMVARTDLSTDESAAALADALVAVPFTEARAAYLHDVLYGTASASSRPVMAIVVTRALLARADALLSKHAGDLDAAPAALVELSRLYAFLTTDIAVVGRGENGGPGGVPATSYDACADAVAAHLGSNPRWLKADLALAPQAVPVRAQAQLAYLALANETPTRPVDAADALGLTGGLRSLFLETGVLAVDREVDAAHLDALRGLLARLPGARVGVDAIVVGNARPSLAARRAVLGISGEPSRAPAPFGDEVDAVRIDPWTVGAARELARHATRRALENAPSLRALAEKDAQAAGGDPKKALGQPQAASADATLAAAAELLALDAPRAFDVAFARALAGHPEAAAIVSDALGASAAYGRGIALGSVRADGLVATQVAQPITLGPAGEVTAFHLGDHTWTITRGEQGIAVRRDGAPLTAATLGAHTPVAAGIVWSSDGLVFARMQGAPRAGLGPGARVRVVGPNQGPGKGLDAIGTSAPGDDVAVEADLAVEGEGALAVRAMTGKTSIRGAALVLTSASAGEPAKATAALRLFDGEGHVTELAPAVDLPPASRFHVRLVVRGTRIDATVGRVSLRGTLPASFAHGDVALAAAKGHSLEATSWSVRRP